MATARLPASAHPHLLVGQTVHYRDLDRCWAAAIVESAPEERAQLFLFPLPPTHPMPQAPGVFIRHDPDRDRETWHRLSECVDGGDGEASTPRSRRKVPRKKIRRGPVSEADRS